jgi:nucleotide-binding universal stress UspA family protein
VDSPYAHIACCIDDSDASRLALDEARRLRSLAPGRLSLVHVAQWPPPYAGGFGVWLPEPELLFSEAREWLDAQAAAVPEAEPVFLEGYPAAEACEWALEAGVDLMVAASHRGVAARITLGSFAHYLIHHAPCPVLIARPKASGGTGQGEGRAAGAREHAGEV